MPLKAVVRKGDPTTGGGVVLGGAETFASFGKPVATLGEVATCRVPGHPSTVKIVEASACHLIHGKGMAYDGCMLSCGCRVLATSHTFRIEVEEVPLAPTLHPLRNPEAHPAPAKKEEKAALCAEDTKRASATERSKAEASKETMSARDRTRAELYARPTDPKKNQKGDMAHAFWLIKEINTDKWFEVTGGPDTRTGRVIGYVNDAFSKDIAIKRALCGVAQNDLQLLGSCTVLAMHGTRAGLNSIRDRFNATIGSHRYHWQGPNSNTYANIFGQGLGIIMPPNTQTIFYNLYGWNWK